MDLNKCKKCNKPVVITKSGTIACVNDNCNVFIIGLIYNKSVSEIQHLKILKQIDKII